MAESLSLSVGDRLVYPNQGLCTVTEIKNEKIAGHELVFVSLVILETGAKVKVPQEKMVKNGVRRVSTADDVKAVFDFLKGESEKASLDWKKRARDNTARLSEGGLLGLAEVVKGLQVLSELRPLPPKEREQYNDARHLFVEELAAALAISPRPTPKTRSTSCFSPSAESGPSAASRSSRAWWVPTTSSASASESDLHRSTARRSARSRGARGRG